MDDQLMETLDDNALQTLYAKIIYSLRESRKELLKQHAVANEAELLEKIRTGEVAEHPSYEHYLGALIVDQMRLQLRAQASEQLSGIPASEDAPVSVHLLLKDAVEAHYAHRLAEPVRLAQDALLLSFDNGLMVEARYFSRDEYSIGWCYGDAEFRIDTAPVHIDGASFPHHLHDGGAAAHADRVSCPGLDCWSNFSRLIDRLLDQPLLEFGEGLRT
jgi:hypothetical protein